MTERELFERIKADKAIADVIAQVGISIEPKPIDLPNRPGFSWKPIQTVAGGSITWVESEYDPQLPGTTENPIPFEPGMEVLPNYYYVLDDTRKVWFGVRGKTPEWSDVDFIEF